MGTELTKVVYPYSEQSLAILETCHVDLVRLFMAVANSIDTRIICGHRSEEAQMIAFFGGQSRTRWPDSKHNYIPSRAVDAAPYPIDWNDLDRFYYFGGIVKGYADRMKIPIRWGGDWQGDNNLKNQEFFDLVHFELLEEDDA